ncbi:MAG: DNA-directed RNA polymerase II subunit [Siphoviridae sp. ctpQM7]|nr:MAG: DNA-directed RNA polymerase II subunit [Siphoviridae sp. ctpQM7]
MPLPRVAARKVLSETQSFPENAFFFIVDVKSLRTSQFILTPNAGRKTLFALGTKINGKVFQSDWWEEDEKDIKPILDHAMRQLVLIQKTGWFKTDETRLDDELHMFRESLFRCAYCGFEMTEPKKPCICRQVAHKMQRKP